jgi:hypothetical protein
MHFHHLAREDTIGSIQHVRWDGTLVDMTDTPHAVDIWPTSQTRPTDSRHALPVRVFDEATMDDLGIVHMPLPVAIGDRLAVEDHPVLYEVVDVIPSVRAPRWRRS